MSTKVLSILIITIGFIFYSAYPISIYYNVPLSEFVVFLFVSLGCSLMMLGNLLKHYSNKLLICLLAIFIAFSLLSIVINNITIRFWLITIIAILFYWYNEKKYKKKNGDNVDKI